MANPWFIKEDYLTSKLAQLRAAGDNTYSNIVSLDAALETAGFTAFSHFEAFGSIERTSPNKLFNATEYLEAKAAQLNKLLGNTKVWTADNVALEIKDAGMTVWKHFQDFGLIENVNPSNAFSISAYMADKFLQLQAAEPTKGWTLELVIEAFVTGGIDPITHFQEFGASESMVVKPVPEGEQVTPDASAGKTFTLTTGTDFITGTSGNDTILAGVDGGTAGTGTTLNAGDQINGGAGVDTLKIFDSATSTNATNFAAASIQNVEIVENHGALALDVSGNAGVKEAWQFAATGSVTATTAQKIGLSGNVGPQTATFVGAETTSNAATIALKDAGIAGTAASVATDGTTIENLTLELAGKNVVSTLTDAALETLTITGAGSVAGDAGAATAIAGTTTLKSVNASTNTGGVNLSVASTVVAAAGFALTGGSGNDSATLTGLSIGKTTVDLGAGNDKLNINTLPTVAGSTFNGGDGTDTLVLDGLTTMDATAGKMFSNFESISLTNAATFKVGDIAGVTSFGMGTGNNTLTNVADGASVALTGAGTQTITMASTTAPTTAVSVSINNGATTAAAGLAENIVTTAKVLNVSSDGLVTSAAHNTLTLSGTSLASVVNLNITGNQALDVTTGNATALTLVDGSAATGNLVLNAALATTVGGVQIYGGSGNDIISASVTGGVIKGNLGADYLKGGAGADVFTFAAGDSSAVNGVVAQGATLVTGATIDAILGFGTGADKIDFGSTSLASIAHTEGATAGRASIDVKGLATFNAADATVAQQLAAVVAAVGSDAAGTSVVWTDGTNSHLFVSNGVAGLDANDALIQIAGVVTTGLTFTAGDISAFV